MGIIKNFQDRGRAVKLGKAMMGEGLGFKASTGQGMLSELARMLQPQWSEAPQKNITEWLELYATSPRLDPVHKIAEDVSTVEWGLYKNLGGGEKELVEDHPLIDLFNKPNPMPESSWFMLLYMTEVYMFLAGEAFWVLEKTGLNQIGEIWIIPPDWVESTPTLSKDYYEVSTKEGQRMQIPSEDVVYFKEPNLKSPYGRGRGRAIAIGDEVETDEYMAKWSKNFFFNDAKPPFVINAPGASKADTERIQEGWLQKYGGLKNAHKPAVLPFTGSVTELGNSQKEMDFVESRKYLRDQANQHFRVPPELMGIIENSNRATIDAADYIYRSSVLINRLTRIQRTIQTQIVDRFHESENLIFSFEDVIPSDKEFDLKVATEGLKSGAIKVDEWRQKVGMDPTEDGSGDVYLIPTTHTPVRNHLDAAVTEPPPTTPSGPGKVSIEQDDEEDEDDELSGEKSVKKSFPTYKAVNWKDGYTAEDLVEISSSFDSVQLELEREMAKSVHRFMRNQGKRFARYVDGLDIKEVYELTETKETKAPSGDEQRDAEEQAESILDGFDWIDEQNKLHENMSPSMLLAAQRGNQLANDTFEMGVSFNLIRDEMLQHIASDGFEKVVGITAQTIALLKKEVVNGILEGLGSEQLAKRIREASDEYGYRRSFVIARTESHSTMVNGAFKTYEEGGSPNKQWLTIIDGRQRFSHSTIDGEIRPIKEKFTNGLMFPGDPSGRAEEVIQCRCALLPAD